MTNILSISFWIKETGNMLSHTSGLSKEQIEALQSLKEGDRLILWKNESKNENTPNYTLKVFKSKTQ